MDQANTLRKIMQNRNGQKASAPPMIGPQVITVSSGKGGVGKSSFVANVGTKLARDGLRVLLVDGDLGLANLDILLGVQATATLEDVLSGRAPLQQSIVGVEQNLWLIPSASGFLNARSADANTRSKLISLFDNCPWEMDVILIDLGAGIQDNVLSLHNPTYLSTVMLTSEPTSFTDAFGLIKLLRREVGISTVNIIVNQVTDGREGQQIFQKLKDVASRFIDVQLDYLGHWQKDEKITQSVMKRKILLDLDQGAPSIPSLELLAKRLKSKCTETSTHLAANEALINLKNGKGFELKPLTGNTAGFWRTLLGEVKA
jgi:flagellar biosynthesis protein FlhG